MQREWGISLLVGAALLMPTANGSAPKAGSTVKAVIERQIDRGGPRTEAAVVRASDQAVWVEVQWEPALTTTAKYAVTWCDSTGKAIIKDEAEIKAGTKGYLFGVFIAGKPLAAKPGNYSVKIREANSKSPVADVPFQLEPAASDPNKPAFTATLCAGVNTETDPVGPTRAFFTDNNSVWVALAAKGKVPEGHALNMKIYQAKSGELALQGQPFLIKPNSDKFGSGFYIAGREWARAGGDFVFKVFWDEDPTPVATLPFKISAGNRYAVLVGIKDYPPAGPERDLPGCDKDVENMERMLKNSFGVPADHITLVRDLEATKKNIEKALVDLADKAKPGDAVLFYYSGHGALVPDLNGDEEDGWDEAIVPAEDIPALVSNETDLGRFLTDDRIGELLRRFKTKNVTVIFDSCHSGTAVRDGEAEPPAQLSESKFRKFDYSRELLRRARKASLNRPRTETHLTMFKKRGVVDDTKPVAGSHADITGDGFVFLASSRPWETSGCNGLGGFFTMALVKALETADGQSWEQIMATVSARVADRRAGQNPGVEGNVKRLPFSTETVSGAMPYLRPFVQVVGALKADDKKAVQEDSGSAGTHRALLEGYQNLYIEQAGALYDAYPQSDAALSGKPSGRLRITGKVETSYSSADILSGKVQKGDRLIPVCVALPSARPRVNVMVDTKTADKGKLTDAALAIQKELKKIDGIEMPDSFKFSEMDCVVEPQMRNGLLTAYVWSSGGWRITNFSGTPVELATKIADFVRTRHAQETRLVRIANPSPTFRLSATVLEGDRLYSPGETVKIKVETGAACYLAVVSAANGQVGPISLLDDALTPDQAVVISVTIPKGYNGVLPIKFLAFKDRPDAKTLTDAPAIGRVDALVQAIRQKYGNGGGGDRYLATDGWADATVRITIAK